MKSVSLHMITWFNSKCNPYKDELWELSFKGDENLPEALMNTTGKTLREIDRIILIALSSYHMDRDHVCSDLYWRTPQNVSEVFASGNQSRIYIWTNWNEKRSKICVLEVTKQFWHYAVLNLWSWWEQNSKYIYLCNI